MGIGRVRILCQRLLETNNGLRRIALLVTKHAKEMQNGGVIRLAAEQFPVDPFRVIQQPLLMKMKRILQDGGV